VELENSVEAVLSTAHLAQWCKEKLFVKGIFVTF